MFGSKTKLYTVLIKKKSPEPLKETVFVKSGFNLYAFIFFSFWALFNRVWLLAVALFAIEIAASFYPQSLFFDKAYFEILLTALHFWIGFEANDIKISNLEQNGYIVFDVVSGVDEIDAERRFYDKYLFYTTNLSNQTAGLQSA